MKQKLVKRILCLSLTAMMTLSPMVVSAAGSGSNTGSNPSDSGQTVTTVTEKSKSGGSGSSKSTDKKQNDTIITSAGVISSTINGNYSVKGVEGVAVRSPLAEVFAAAGCKKGEYAYAVVRDSACGELALNSLKAAASALNTPEGPIIDFYMTKVSASEQNEVLQFNAPITLTVGIPAGLRSADRDFALIRVVKGGEITVLADTDSDANTISIATDQTGVYMLTYGTKGYFDALRK